VQKMAIGVATTFGGEIDEDERWCQDTVTGIQKYMPMLKDLSLVCGAWETGGGHGEINFTAWEPPWARDGNMRAWVLTLFYDAMSTYDFTSADLSAKIVGASAL